MESFDDPDLAVLDRTGGLTSSHFNFPLVSPLWSAGVVSLGGAYHKAPGWSRVVDKSTFVVSSGDICASQLFYLSAINLFVQLKGLICHGHGFTLFCTSFLTLDVLETCLEPLLLIIPHSVGTPLPLRDVTCVPIFALLLVTAISTSVSDISSAGFSDWYFGSLYTKY